MNKVEQWEWLGAEIDQTEAALEKIQTYLTEMKVARIAMVHDGFNVNILTSEQISLA
jgi:hypothetical protein